MSDITKTITVNIGDVCRNPFYVVWVNPLGGYEQYMFQINQLFNVDVEEMGRAGIYVEDVATAKGNMTATRYQAKPRVQVVAAAITTNEAKALETIRYSPFVFLYRPATDDFLKILPIPGSFLSYATDKIQQDVQCEFELPTLITPAA